jgi:hypothetical protein
MEAWLKRMGEGGPLFDDTLHVYNSDDDPQELVGKRVAAPFHAVKGKPDSGEKWCVRAPPMGGRGHQFRPTSLSSSQFDHLHHSTLCALK